jgi:hypothetical protein
MLLQHMKGFAVLMLVAATAFADDVPWSTVAIEAMANVVEGQPATLRLIIPPSVCVLPCLPYEVVLNPSDTVTWSFGDGSPDVTVTGSPRVTHTFPRGWFEVTAVVRQQHVIRNRIFSQAVPVSPPSYVDIASAPQAVSENGGPYIVKLVRSGNLGVSSTLGFEAVQPTDYGISNLKPSLTTTSGTVTFAPGETSKGIVVELLDDNLYEGSRYAGLTIWSVDGALIRPYPSSLSAGAMTAVWFYIHDDETPPTLSVADVEVIEGSDRPSEAVFNVTLSAPLARSWRLSYVLRGLTATAGTDFINPPNAPTLLLIPPGVTAVPVLVT